MNLYESPAGISLAGVRCGTWLAFICSVGNTIKKFPEKQTFYIPFGVFGTIWILGGPAITLIGVFILDAWVGISYLVYFY